MNGSGPSALPILAIATFGPVVDSGKYHMCRLMGPYRAVRGRCQKTNHPMLNTMLKFAP